MNLKFLQLTQFFFAVQKQKLFFQIVFVDAKWALIPMSVMTICLNTLNNGLFGITFQTHILAKPILGYLKHI